MIEWDVDYGEAGVSLRLMCVWEEGESDDHDWAVM